MATFNATNASPPATPRQARKSPQQYRSKASLVRMLAAARSLMLERGGEDFTLHEVAAHGNVSIGSIYFRFKNKDELVRAVNADALDHVLRDESAALAQVRLRSTCLSEFVPLYVEAYADVLLRHAAMLRIAMQRAAIDPLASRSGREGALKSSDSVVCAMLEYSAEFGRGDAATKAVSAYYVIFAALARELSLGSTNESVRGLDWRSLSRELGRMCVAYLKSDA